MAPLNGWACAVEICHDGMLEDTNSLDGAHIIMWRRFRRLDDEEVLEYDKRPITRTGFSSPEPNVHLVSL